MSKPHKGKSPYSKYEKKPYVYSGNLQNWTAAVKAGDKQAMEHYDKLWRQAHGVPPAEECVK